MSQVLRTLRTATASYGSSPVFHAPVGAGSRSTGSPVFGLKVKTDEGTGALDDGEIPVDRTASCIGDGCE
jgi:hypothetical protein